MWSLRARDQRSLRDVSGAVHDAYIAGPIEHDAAAGIVTVPFLQEGWAGGPAPEVQHERETWRYRESQVTFFRGRLVIRGVRVMHAPEEWLDWPEINSVDFVPGVNELRVWSDDPLRLRVDAVDVEVVITREPGLHVRRRAGKLLGIVSNKWLDQQPVRSVG